MIKIKDKKDCCGCNACVQKCPKSCIAMQEDKEGFLYPQVNIELCIDCGLCEKVCPVINQNEPRKPLKVYAAKNNNEEIRMQSSSGGIFTLLAEKVIQESGVVFGARFDENWEVKHDYTETIEGLAAFRGSKYVQSRIEDNYQKVEQFLKQGRKVLFSGTPCQIAGLKCFLRKEYSNLLTVDFICHGVPSPGVWRQYLKERVARMCDKNSVSTAPISKENAHIESISFRDKRLGWKKFSFALTLSATDRSGVKNTVSLLNTKYKNPFLIGFLRDLYLRPSCHHCPSKGFNSSSDITIADFWGINDYMPKENDHKGYSLVFIHNDKVKIDKQNIEFSLLNIKEICKNNRTIYNSSKPHPNRKTFFNEMNKNSHTIEFLIGKYSTVSLKKKIHLLIANLLGN